MIELPWADLATIGPWGVVTLFFLLVFFGILVPGRREKEWKDLYLAERASREDMQGLMGLLRKVLKALPASKDEEE